MKTKQLRVVSFFIIGIIAAMLLYSTIIILPVKAQNGPYATFWIEIVSSYGYGSPGLSTTETTIRLHPEGCYAINAEIVDYKWTLNSNYPTIIHKNTSDSFEYTFSRSGNWGAMRNLDGRTINLTVTDSNGLTSTFVSDPLVLPKEPIASFWLEIVECNISSATIRLHSEATHPQYYWLVSYTWTFNSTVPQTIHKNSSTVVMPEVFEYTFPRSGDNSTMYNLEGRTITLTVVDYSGLTDSYSQVVPFLPPTNIIPEVPFGTMIALFSMISALLISIMYSKRHAFTFPSCFSR